MEILVKDRVRKEGCGSRGSVFHRSACSHRLGLGPAARCAFLPQTWPGSPPSRLAAGPAPSPHTSVYCDFLLQAWFTKQEEEDTINGDSEPAAEKTILQGTKRFGSCPRLV